MASTRFRKTLATLILAYCIFGLTIGGAAVSATITIESTTISATQTRDGRTLTLGYQITSNADTTAVLGASLTGPYGELVKDVANNGAGVSVAISAGTGWYYRNFMVNLPPIAPAGIYDVNWTVSWDSGSASSTGVDCLTMLSPISVRVPILMYHKIGPALYSQYWITTSTLRAQMAALKAYGYTAITCRELMDIRAGLMTAPAKPIMLTFDGGYQNFCTDALPTIMNEGYKVVLFEMTGYMGQDNSWDGDNNPVIMFMTWDELTSVYNTGYVDLESHTVKHNNLATCSADTRTWELIASRQTLQDAYGESIDFFCYPYGAYNEDTKTAVREAGYFGAFGAWGGVDTTCADKWALKRVPVYSDSVMDYDPGKPNSFFFKQIGDLDVKVPGITINSVQYLNPATNAPLANNELMWGQTVKVRVVATNASTAADVIVNLALDTDTNFANGSVFDSHSSPTQDILVTSWTGQKTFEWLWTAPIDIPIGRYYSRISFRDKYYVMGFIKPSNQQAFTTKYNLWQMPTAKTAADNAWGVIKNAVISAAFADCFYIETDSRNVGIRIEKAGHGIEAGMRVDVAGPAATNASGERCVAATVVANKGTGSISPLGLPNKLIGGGSIGAPPLGQRGIAGGSGLNNIGLLVRTWGKIKQRLPDSQAIIIDDGSGADLKCIWTGTNPIDPSWNYVTVTGISSCEKTGIDLTCLLLITRVEGWN